MRTISFLTTCLIALLLAACGGGGGSPGVGSGSVQALSVVAPPALTLQVGSSAKYAIRGGVKDYQVFSSEPNIAVGWLVSADELALGAVAPGKAVITVVDRLGAKVDIAVTGGSSTVFFTTAPGALTLAPGAAGARTFQLGGGAGKYTAYSSDTNVATVDVKGSTATITGIRGGTTATAKITFFDDAGQSLETTVTVKAIPLAINPTSITAFIGDTVFARISGGTPPYKIDTGLTDAVAATLANDNELTIMLLRKLPNYEFNVVDANGQVATLKLNADIGTNVFRLSPASLRIDEQESQPILLTVYGASTTGTPTVFSSNKTLMTATINENTVTVKRGPACVAANTDVEITVVDGKGAVGVATVTILNSDPAACP